MRCRSCGHLNSTGVLKCTRCSKTLNRDAAGPSGAVPGDHPDANPTVRVSKTTIERKKVKSEILALFQVDTAKPKGPGGTTRATRGGAASGGTPLAGAGPRPPLPELDLDSPEGPRPAPGGAGAPAAEGAAPTTRSGRLLARVTGGARSLKKHTTRLIVAMTGSGRKTGAMRGAPLEACAGCRAPFPPHERYSVRGKHYCEPCFRKRASVFKPDDVEEAEEGNRAARDLVSPDAPDDAPRPATGSVPTTSAARRAAAPGGTATGAMSRCIFHPAHTTKETCATCRRPICALCTVRQGPLTLCTECDQGGTVAPIGSARYDGLGGSSLETVVDVLLHPGVFFRNLPASGPVVGPFCFGVLAWTVGNAALLVTLALALEGGEAPMSRLLDRAVAMACAAVVLGLADVCCAAVLVAGGARLVGARFDLGLALRATSLGAAPAFALGIPLLGLLIAPVAWLRATIELGRETLKLELVPAAAVAVATLAGLAAVNGVVVRFVLFD